MAAVWTQGGSCCDPYGTWGQILGAGEEVREGVGTGVEARKGVGPGVEIEGG